MALDCTKKCLSVTVTHFHRSDAADACNRAQLIIVLLLNKKKSEIKVANHLGIFLTFAFYHGFLEKTIKIPWSIDAVAIRQIK